MGEHRRSAARPRSLGDDRARVPPRHGGRQRGKIGALRALLTGDDLAPGRDADPYLLRVYTESKTLRAIWAERFNLPRSDPRYQDATEDDVIRDLLVAMYRAAERRRADPLESQLDDVLRDPAGTAEAERAFEASLEETGTLGARIRAFERARHVEEPEPVSIRIRTARTPRS